MFGCIFLLNEERPINTQTLNMHTQDAELPVQSNPIQSLTSSITMTLLTLPIKIHFTQLHLLQLLSSLGAQIEEKN